MLTISSQFAWRSECAHTENRREECLETVLGESVCPYCGVGCRLQFEGLGRKVSRVRGVEHAPANLGGLCAKGAQLGPTIDTHDRLSQPQLRLGRQEGFRPTDWNTALAYIAEIFVNILYTH